jgi:hypothetical protein
MSRTDRVERGSVRGPARASARVQEGGGGEILVRWLESGDGSERVLALLVVVVLVLALMIVLVLVLVVVVVVVLLQM